MVKTEVLDTCKLLHFDGNYVLYNILFKLNEQSEVKRSDLTLFESLMLKYGETFSQKEKLFLQFLVTVSTCYRSLVFQISKAKRNEA